MTHVLDPRLRPDPAAARSVCTMVRAALAADAAFAGPEFTRFLVTFHPGGGGGAAFAVNPDGVVPFAPSDGAALLGIFEELHRSAPTPFDAAYVLFDRGGRVNELVTLHGHDAGILDTRFRDPAAMAAFAAEKAEPTHNLTPSGFKAFAGKTLYLFGVAAAFVILFLGERLVKALAHWIF